MKYKGIKIRNRYELHKLMDDFFNLNRQLTTNKHPFFKAIFLNEPDFSVSKYFKFRIFSPSNLDYETVMIFKNHTMG